MKVEEICINKTRRNKCNNLIVKTCLGDKCTFMRTAKQQEESRKYVFKRLSMLDKELQIYIADKYYDGSMPWEKGGRSI